MQIFFGGLYFGTEGPATKRYTEHRGTTGNLDLPELIPLLESVAIQLREVGIELELEEPDLVAVIQPMTRERRAN